MVNYRGDSSIQMGSRKGLIAVNYRKNLSIYALAGRSSRFHLEIPTYQLGNELEP
jgi:hypothetical protein